jgi:hypothetical protein
MYIMGQVIKHIYRFGILLACLLFVTWQTSKCFDKYIKNPQGTKLEIIYTAGQNFPAVTVCGHPEYRSTNLLYNETNLNLCGIKRPKAYRNEGMWTGFGHENCTDPERLFNNSIANAKDVINYITYSFFDSKVPLRYDPHKNSKVWSHVDLKHYGRCFTATPPDNINLYGIKEMRLNTWTYMRVFFHTPGVLDTNRQRLYIDQNVREKYYIDLEHEVFHMLDFGGGSCSKEEGYNRDLCSHERLYKVQE